MSYDHLYLFICKAFVHVPKDERSKLDAKTRQCIFIGYGLDGEFGYRLYDPDIGDFDAPIDDVVTDQQQAPIAPPAVPLRRSFRDRQSFCQDKLRDAVLLVFGNKQDLPNAMNVVEITGKLVLHSLRQSHW
ncbi:hypothetical protein V6N12_058351 [Hibiscus sabdariffa]|uniref:Retroviral polymerase SH3-like domain-containing protein n=1 Tax=Hibiscus sabdariffa TaxID=183260 RepID=A0ABR2ETV2_9ROSI